MRKISVFITLALVLSMVFSAFAVFTPAVTAETINEDNEWNLRIPTTSESPSIDGTDLDNIVHYPGEQDVTFFVKVLNDDPFGDSPSDEPLYYVNMSIDSNVRDEEGAVVLPSPISWVNPPQRDDSAEIDDTETYQFFPFKFDIEPDAEPGTYNLTVSLSFKNDSYVQKTDQIIGFILFDIENRGEPSDIGGLMPGDLDKDINVFVSSTGGSMNIDDIYLNITLPDNDFSWFGTASLTSASFDTGPLGLGQNFPFTISVDRTKNAGTYTGSYTLEYTNPDGIRCTETGDIDFTVGQLAMLEATVSSSTIAQGTTLLTMTLTLSNTGTLDLVAVEIRVDDDSAAFTSTPADHWEGGNMVTYDWVEVGDVMRGATITVNMTIGIDIYIPPGDHKIMFEFKAKYYDPDTLQLTEAHQWWESASPSHPVVQMGSTTNHFYPDKSSVTGTFIMLNVTDTGLDIDISSTVTLDLSGRLIDNTLTVLLDNYGEIDYSNLVVQVETNTANSPFLNVIDPTALLSEEAKLDSLVGGWTQVLNLMVSLKSTAAPGVYSVPVQITALNLDMGEIITDTADARITLKGVGPKLEITSVSPDSIKKGEDFTLTLSITNNGDDTARNVIITMPAAAADLGELWLLLGATNDLDGDLASPQPTSWPIYLPDIAPGGNVTVTLQMRSNADMSTGHVFTLVFAIDYVDSFGEGPGETALNHEVVIKTSGGGGSVLGDLYWSLGLLVIVIAIVLMMLAILQVAKYRRGKKGQEIEDEPEPEVEPYQEPKPDYGSTPPPPTNPPESF